jgi:uncharacterized protein (DUF488 family)
MYYRRKILLALIEVFGGSLKSTDCEKLLFNFCQQREKNHYDFFPHKSLFKTYETKLLPKQEIEIKQLIDLTEQNERIALVCFEADHKLCHRHTLIEHLQKNKSFKMKVVHL